MGHPAMDKIREFCARSNEMTTDRERLAEAQRYIMWSQHLHINALPHVESDDQLLQLHLDHIADLRAWLAHDEGRDDE